MEARFEDQYRLFEKDWWWFVGRHDLISRIFSGLKYNSHVKILEVGCGSGENSKIFNDSATYYGVDISLKSIKNGEHHNNLVAGLAGSLPFIDKTFDVVLFLDVLEHLEDEKSALEETRRVLKDKGVLLILVPVFDFLWSEHDVLNQHKRRYNKGKFAALLSINRFDISMLSYWNFFLFPPVAIMRLIKKYSKTQEKSDFAPLPGIINNVFLANLLRIENYLISKGFYLPIGVSLLCMSRKNNREQTGKGK